VVYEKARCFFAVQSDAIGPFQTRRSRGRAAAIGGKADTDRMSLKDPLI
jgi:hypothetical protein